MVIRAEGVSSSTRTNYLNSRKILSGSQAQQQTPNQKKLCITQARGGRERTEPKIPTD